jgi:hypothetical protein
MGTAQAIYLNDAEADLLPDSHHHRDRAVLQQPFDYPTEGWSLLAWNAGVAVLGLAGTLFALATCI